MAARVKPYLGVKSKLAIMLIDAVVFSLALYLVIVVRFLYWKGSYSSTLFHILRSFGVSDPGGSSTDIIFVVPQNEFVLFGSVLFPLCSFLYLFGTYELDRAKGFSTYFVRVSMSSILTLFVVSFLTFVFQLDRSGFLGRGVLFGSLTLYTVFSVLTRTVVSSVLVKRNKNAEWLFILPNEMWQKLSKDLKVQNQFGRIKVLTEAGTSPDTPLSPVVGEWPDIQQELKNDYAGVVVALNEPDLWRSRADLFMQARFAGARIVDVSSFYEATFQKVPVFYLNPDYFFVGDGFRLLANPVGIRLKRLVDIVLSLILFLFSWPLMIIAAFAIKVDSSGPALFSQVRTGKDGRLFTIYKFRSMKTDAEKDGAQWAKTQDSRVTRVGRWLRLTRIDELPQLLNVFRGDMSFVGPRPERPEFNVNLESQIPYYNLRHMVRPGLTGWAQVLYPYGASVEDAVEKLQYELYYIKHQSVWLDLKIVLLTIRVVILGRGR